MDDEARQVHDAAGGEPSPPPGLSLVEDFPVSSDDENWKKVRDLALRQLHRFLSYEAKVLKGNNPEAIHDMRVASRRLQQVLDILYPKPRPPELRRMRGQVRRSRQVLGDVRNCDALLDLVKGTLAKKRTAHREAWTAVEHHLQIRRSQSFLRATRKLGKINLAVLYVNLKEFLTHDKAHAQGAEHHHHGSPPQRPAFAIQLTQTLQSVWKAFEDQVTLSFHDSRPAVIHGARIATKRLRYLVEVFQAFDVAGSAEALTWLRQLQQQLGDWHDREVLEQMMIEMLAQPKFLREQLPLAMEVERLILRNRKSKAGLEAKYFQMVRGSPETRRLKDWVAYLAESPSAAFATVSAGG
jgi:CHAD domain-containing protein